MYINGRNAVLEAIRAETRIDKIFVLYGTSGEGIDAIKSAAKRSGVPCVTIDREKFKRLERKAEVKTRSQGVIAWIDPITYVEVIDIVSDAYEAGRVPLVVVLDGITDPHNVGAIIRSAECAGLDGVIVGKRNAGAISDVVVKTSAGATHHMPIARVNHLGDTLDRMKEMGIRVIGLDERGEAAYYDVDMSVPTALVIGSEGEGMAPHVRRRCDLLVSIPMMGKIASLNASVAAGVVFFEARRQREIDPDRRSEHER